MKDNFPIQIPFSEIESIPNIVKDFLAQKLPEFSKNLLDLDNIKETISRKKAQFSSEKRELLVKAIDRQYSDFRLTNAQKHNLDLLRNEDTFTIVTGHQLNLFTGPSFFIYKILQTIKTAEFITENLSDTQVVPVFWLASEDHDFEEINHFKTPLHHYEIKGKSGGAVGRIKVEDLSFIEEFEKEFKDFPYGTELVLRLKEAYKKGNTLSQATKTIAQWLFGEMGLLCIDGDDAELKSQMKGIFRDEILNQSLHNKTQNKVQYLTEKYGKVQVNPREINLFYLSETRNRIERNEETYRIVDTDKTLTEEEILQELENHPERFSPNALMRPIYQENILPNLAYIGGNAEVAYWLELKDYFDYLELPFPILVPRNSMLFLSSKVFNKIEKLGLEIKDFFGNFTEIVNNQLIENHPLNSVLEEKENFILSIFDELVEKSSLTDITFRNLVEAEKTRQLKSYQRMQKRLLRAEKIKQKEKLERVERIFYEIHPAKNWQERVYNFSHFYAEKGSTWIQSCYAIMNVRDAVLVVAEV